MLAYGAESDRSLGVPGEVCTTCTYLQVIDLVFSCLRLLGIRNYRKLLFYNVAL